MLGRKSSRAEGSLDGSVDRCYHQSSHIGFILLVLLLASPGTSKVGTHRNGSKEEGASRIQPEVRRYHALPPVGMPVEE